MNLLFVNRSDFPLLDLIIGYVDQIELIRLVLVCKSLRLLLMKSPIFRKMLYSWRHSCSMCDETDGYICDGQRRCYRHLPDYCHYIYDIGLEKEAFDWRCACTEIPLVPNNQICAWCCYDSLEESFVPFERCHCYVKRETRDYPFYKYVRHQNIIRIQRQDESIIYVHDHCQYNLFTAECPFAYTITHDNDCQEVPKPIIADSDSDSE